MFKKIGIVISVVLFSTFSFARSEMCTEAVQQSRQCATMPAISVAATVVTGMLTNQESVLATLANNSNILGMFIQSCEQSLVNCTQACSSDDPGDERARRQCMGIGRVLSLARATLGQMQVQSAQVSSSIQQVSGGGEPIEGNQELMVPDLNQSPNEAFAELSDETGVGIGGGLSLAKLPNPPRQGPEKVELNNMDNNKNPGSNLPIFVGDNNNLQRASRIRPSAKADPNKVDWAARSRLMNLNRISKSMSNRGASSGSRRKARGTQVNSDVQIVNAGKVRGSSGLKRPSEVLQAQMNKVRTITSYGGHQSFIFKTICQSYNRAEKSMNLSEGYVQCPENP